MSALTLTSPTFEQIQDRYRRGEWRASIFYDAVAAEIRSRGDSCTVLDIGCGGGFDGSSQLQRQLAELAGTAIGVEPDSAAAIQNCFSEVHRSVLESAGIRPASVDVAWAIMVAEHVANPKAFLAKAADVLVDGGVLWMFTVDSRHWSAWASWLFEKLSVKDRYLDRLHGKRGVDRYENFPVCYRLNSPRLAKRLAGADFETDAINLFRVGAEDFNLPSWLRPLNHGVDRVLSFFGAPGSNLVLRLKRRPRHC